MGNTYDFGRSFLQFTTDRVQHTPRLRVLAACTLSSPEGSRQFVLAGTCISEHMYRESGLIQVPSSVFHLISDGTEYLMEKFHASAEHDVRESHRVGQTMSTHDGRGATVRKIDIELKVLDGARPLRTYAEIREAVLGNRVVTAQTVYELADATRVQLDYPVEVFNVPHSHEGWQVDTGPLLIPDPDLAGEDLWVARLGTAYTVFNRWDRAEFVLRTRSPVGEAGATRHFAKLWAAEPAENSLFCEGG